MCPAEGVGLQSMAFPPLELGFGVCVARSPGPRGNERARAGELRPPAVAGRLTVGPSCWLLAGRPVLLTGLWDA